MNDGTSVARRTSSTATAYALDNLVLRQLRLWHTTDTGGLEVCFLSLDAFEAA